MMSHCVAFCPRKLRLYTRSNEMFTQLLQLLISLGIYLFLNLHLR